MTTIAIGVNTLGDVISTFPILESALCTGATKPQKSRQINPKEGRSKKG
jgi:hypothetical protein